MIRHTTMGHNDETPHDNNPKTHRHFTVVERAMRSLWIRHYIDRRENRARGALVVGDDEYVTHLSMHETDGVTQLRLIADAGQLASDRQPHLIAVLMHIQAHGQAVRVVPDLDCGTVRLDVGTHLSQELDPAPVLSAMVKDLRRLLSDDRLIACLESTPGRRFTEMEV